MEPGPTASKMRAIDRKIILAPIEGQFVKNSAGLIDKRLFTGENCLHAIMDTQTCLWHLKYDCGAMPPPLQQRYTGFNSLYKDVETYFKKRNIEIKEVQD